MQRNTLTALILLAFVFVVGAAGAVLFADSMQHRPKPKAGSDLEGDKVLRLKNGDQVSVGEDGKARVNGIPVSCKAARKLVLSTMPMSQEKLATSVPCKS